MLRKYSKEPAGGCFFKERQATAAMTVASILKRIDRVRGAVDSTSLTSVLPLIVQGY